MNQIDEIGAIISTRTSGRLFAIGNDRAHLLSARSDVHRHEGKRRIFIRAIEDRSYDSIIGIPRRFLAQPLDQLFPPGRPFAIGYTFVIRSLVRSEKTRLREEGAGNVLFTRTRHE